MTAARAWAVASLIVVVSWHLARATAQTSPARMSRERVTFKSDGLTLVGFLFQPDGPGPQDVLAFFAGALR